MLKGYNSCNSGFTSKNGIGRNLGNNQKIVTWKKTWGQREYDFFCFFFQFATSIQFHFPSLFCFNFSQTQNMTIQHIIRYLESKEFHSNSSRDEITNRVRSFKQTHPRNAASCTHLCEIDIISISNSHPIRFQTG